VGRLALGKQPQEAEETFSVAGDVKPALASLRAAALFPLEPTPRPLRAATGLRALAGVRRLRRKRPSRRVGSLRTPAPACARGAERAPWWAAPAHDRSATGAHAWPRRWRRPAGRGAPSPRRRDARGGGAARGLAPPAAPPGARTLRHPRAAPAPWRQRRVRRRCPSRRAVGARRGRRVPSRRAESTTRFATPEATRPRWRQHPARPAASPRTPRASAGQPQRRVARAIAAPRPGTSPAGLGRSRGRGATPVVNPRVQG
jgi:hypothetical protein